LEAQNCVEGVFSFLYLNVYIGFARKFVKIESENFVDCRREKFIICRLQGPTARKFYSLGGAND